jgi:hypothetical protein
MATAPTLVVVSYCCGCCYIKGLKLFTLQRCAKCAGRRERIARAVKRIDAATRQTKLF